MMWAERILESIDWSKPSKIEVVLSGFIPQTKVSNPFYNWFSTCSNFLISMLLLMNRNCWRTNYINWASIQMIIGPVIAAF
jgi:hypothetical protein